MSWFGDAFESLMELEGVHSNDPADAGGDTWYGISRRSHPDAGWPPTRQEAREIYLAEYWEPAGCGQIAECYAVAEKVFHMAVNLGVLPASRYLQVAANGALHSGRLPMISVDGRVGPATAGAVNAICRDELGARYLLRGLRWMSVYHYQNLAARRPAQKRFLRGWMNRALK